MSGVSADTGKTLHSASVLVYKAGFNSEWASAEIKENETLRESRFGQTGLLWRRSYGYQCGRRSEIKKTAPLREQGMGGAAFRC